MHALVLYIVRASPTCRLKLDGHPRMSRGGYRIFMGYKEEVREGQREGSLSWASLASSSSLVSCQAVGAAVAARRRASFCPKHAPSAGPSHARFVRLVVGKIAYPQFGQLGRRSSSDVRSGQMERRLKRNWPPKTVDRSFGAGRPVGRECCLRPDRRRPRRRLRIRLASTSMTCFLQEAQSRDAGGGEAAHHPLTSNQHLLSQQSPCWTESF